VGYAAKADINQVSIFNSAQADINQVINQVSIFKSAEADINEVSIFNSVYNDF
jgi:hypothetical protein